MGSKMILFREFKYLLYALLFIAVALAVTPSSLIITLNSATIDGDDVVLSRDVLFPVDGAWNVEIETTVEPFELLINCVPSGVAHYEFRYGRPVRFAHGCNDMVPGQEYLVRYCVSVIAPIGVNLRQTCQTGEFTAEGAQK